MSYVLGLTGGIATGKSHLSDVLAREGAWIVDADEISRALTAPAGEALPLIRSKFGDEFFTPDGCLERKALGNLVFSDPVALERLNALMHPLILSGIREKIDRLEAEYAQVIVLDAPLLYETGLDSFCKEVWCTWIPRGVQLRRLMLRDGLTRRQALDRMSSQLSAWEKRLRADKYIDTRGSFEESAEKARKLYGELLLRLQQEERNAKSV